MLHKLIDHDQYNNMLESLNCVIDISTDIVDVSSLI